MPKREYTAKNLREALASGQVKPDDTYKLTVSLTYSAFLEFLELRENLRKSTSEMVRDGITALRRNYLRDTMPVQFDLAKIKDEILTEQQKLRAELMNGVKKLAAKEEESTTETDHESLRERVLMFLEDSRFGDGLATKDLAKYVGVDWRAIDKVCVEMAEEKRVTREGSKWKMGEKRE